ncbi:hypothetical protein EKK58_05620 [Candidatus Dependentiae bacterium]|nr:MAG: hypothetical protein EKK58_05620 [Candidatus Dependentiae bacterium]
MTSKKGPKAPKTDTTEASAHAVASDLPPIQVKPKWRKFSELKHPKQNARYMKANQFNQLVNNLKTDGTLTSLPLVYPAGGDVIVSGNHRIDAAMKAGIAEGWVLEIEGELPNGRLTAIQLSHNAIAGEDDLNTLEAMYRDLDFADKAYSGLTDDVFNVSQVDLASLSAGSTTYEEITLMFLPEQRESFEKLLAELGDKASKVPRLVGANRDFDVLFDGIIGVKNTLNVQNTSLALHTLAVLAKERLDQIIAEQPKSDEPPPNDQAATDASVSPGV